MRNDLYFPQLLSGDNHLMKEISRYAKEDDNKREYTHIDCFAGPGGFCTGLTAARFKTLVAIEYIESCCQTYRKNHPEVHCIHSDIRKVVYDDIKDYIPKDGVDIVTSGMPCETFSMAGTTSRSFYDDRQFLFREGIRIAKLSNAKMILFENAPVCSRFLIRMTFVEDLLWWDTTTEKYRTNMNRLAMRFHRCSLTLGAVI